ncbi:GNAT family N-acetyltransferase [Metabacillus niabensis]|uniref:Phosphinothricin acetyltransferase n=1 Tax=Metabacillus niabensis TaxID=324854 RepID=A0ABT9YZ41_9BACI|nr:GNAT family N-acetyltransferase [Metabacillus niabensis]MDQ0225268.1 phosphinothricin acetyltransferase [Metabacillus niabensis]PAD68120.1 N-acetyltransferase [Bacillus sp. 7586-K]
MSEKVNIRDANIDDLTRIVEIYNTSIPGRLATADLEEITVESRIAWFHEHNAERRPLWVLEENNNIVGWLSFQSFYGRPAYNGTAEISIYLDPSVQGKGFGKLLIKEAIANCPKLKIKTILAFVFGHNEPSIRLFETFSFEKWAHLPKIADMEGTERDLVILGKRVDNIS